MMHLYDLQELKHFEAMKASGKKKMRKAKTEQKLVETRTQNGANCFELSPKKTGNSLKWKSVKVEDGGMQKKAKRINRTPGGWKWNNIWKEEKDLNGKQPIFVHCNRCSSVTPFVLFVSRISIWFLEFQKEWNGSLMIPSLK